MATISYPFGSSPKDQERDVATLVAHLKDLIIEVEDGHVDVVSLVALQSSESVNPGNLSLFSCTVTGASRQACEVLGSIAMLQSWYSQSYFAKG